MKICESCGAIILNCGANRRYCDECLKEFKRERKRKENQRLRERKLPQVPKVSRGEEIVQLAKDALACGMSYGQYTAMLRSKEG